MTKEEKTLILSIATTHLLFDYKDYLTDNPNKKIGLDEYVHIWNLYPKDDAYGGNGVYNLYLLTNNCLKDILRHI